MGVSRHKTMAIFFCRQRNKWYLLNAWLPTKSLCQQKPKHTLTQLFNYFFLNYIIIIIVIFIIIIIFTESKIFFKRGNFFHLNEQPCFDIYFYIYIYLYIDVCMCVCVHVCVFSIFPAWDVWFSGVSFSWEATSGSVAASNNTVLWSVITITALKKSR